MLMEEHTEEQELNLISKENSAKDISKEKSSSSKSIGK
jgi:hypothetical protein